MVATRASAKPRVVTKKSMSGLTKFNGARDDVLRKLGFKTFDDFTAAIRREYAKPQYPKNFEGWNLARDAVLKHLGVQGYRGLMSMAQVQNAAKHAPATATRATATRATATRATATRATAAKPRATVAKATVKPRATATKATAKPRAVRRA